MNARSYTLTTLATSLALLVSAGWRWHSAATASPDRISLSEGPAAVLLVQERDCPDRLRGLETWLENLRSETAEGEGADTPLPVYLGALDGDGSVQGTLLADLPRLDASQVARATRAVRRSGLPGTPALLLLDADGRVLLTDTFEPSGPGTRTTLAADLIPYLYARGAHPHDDR